MKPEQNVGSPEWHRRTAQQFRALAGQRAGKNREVYMRMALGHDLAAAKAESVLSAPELDKTSDTEAAYPMKAINPAHSATEGQR